MGAAVVVGGGGDVSLFPYLVHKHGLLGHHRIVAYVTLTAPLAASLDNMQLKRAAYPLAIIGQRMESDSHKLGPVTDKLRPH